MFSSNSFTTSITKFLDMSSTISFSTNIFPCKNPNSFNMGFTPSSPFLESLIITFAPTLYTGVELKQMYRANPTHKGTLIANHHQRAKSL